MQSLLDVLEKHLIAICLGIFGGAIRDLNNTDFSYRKFLVGIMTTAFVAVMVSLLAEELTCPFTFKAVIIAMCGYASKTVLDLLNQIIVNRMRTIGKTIGKKL